MIWQGKEGELRLIEHGLSATTYYLEVLFTEMDFSAPIKRPLTEETLVMNRGMMDTDAHYIQSDEIPRYAPMSMTFSCKLADTNNTRVLSDWLSGNTTVGGLAGSTRIYSWDGKTTIDGNTLPAFADVDKQSYRVEMLWDATVSSGSSYGVRYEEVYFAPDQQTITESADGLSLSCNGMIYGDVTRIYHFTNPVSEMIT